MKEERRIDPWSSPGTSERKRDPKVKAEGIDTAGMEDEVTSMGQWRGGYQDSSIGQYYREHKGGGKSWRLRVRSGRTVKPPWRRVGVLKVLRPGLLGSGEALALPNLKSVLGLGRELLAALLAVVVVRGLVRQVVSHLDDVPRCPRV